MTSSFWTMGPGKESPTKCCSKSPSQFTAQMWWYYLITYYNPGKRPSTSRLTSLIECIVNTHMLNGRSVHNRPRAISWDGLKGAYARVTTLESHGFVCHERWLLIYPVTLEYELNCVDGLGSGGRGYTHSEWFLGVWPNLNYYGLLTVTRLIRMRLCGGGYME